MTNVRKPLKFLGFHLDELKTAFTKINEGVLQKKTLALHYNSSSKLPYFPCIRKTLIK